MDERAAGSLIAPGDQAGRLFAAVSAIGSLPQGRAGSGPEPASPPIRPAAMGDLARRAGYAGAGIVLQVTAPQAVGHLAGELVISADTHPAGPYLVRRTDASA